MTVTAPLDDFGHRVAGYQRRINDHLEHCLPNEDTHPQALHRAMRYSVLGGGKRIRPLLTYACGEVLEVPAALLDAPATAIELVHAFSLVHDDLPAMDDDDLRRGRPTTHRAFDEATAILAGDALQVLAFQVLADDRTLAAHPRVQVAMVTTLADAAGSTGMTGGQAIDLAAAGRTLTLAQLQSMHEKKTGLLICAAVTMACHCAELGAEERATLDQFAQCVGLAFQIRDDILDVEGETTVIGKPQGSDMANNKSTYPALLGLAGAKQHASELFDKALALLDGLDRETSPLRWLAGFIVKRDR